MTNITSISLQKAHNEIDVLAALQVLWRRKLQIVLGGVLFSLLAAVLLLFITPVYEVSSTLRPTGLNELDALNRSGIYSLPPSQALKHIGASLESYEVRFSYFKDNPELQLAFREKGYTQEQAFENFNQNALTITSGEQSSDSLNSYVFITMRYPAGVNGKVALDGLVDFAVKSEQKRIAEDLTAIVKNRLKEVDAQLMSAKSSYEFDKERQIEQLSETDKMKRAKLNDELSALRVQLKLRRQDRIAQLSEAIAIANTLGLKKPSTPSAMSAADEQFSGNINRTEINSQQLPLYFMGSEALEAERKALRNRKSDDFMDPRIAEIRKQLLMLEQNRKIEMLQHREKNELFISNINKLRNERDRLNRINTDTSNIRLVNVDQVAVEPVSPIYPKKGFVILIGGVVGVLVAIFIILLKYAAKVYYRERARQGSVPVANLIESGIKETAAISG